MADIPLITDGVTEFSKGINSGIAPLLLPRNQLSFAINATVRGAFVTHRPTMRKIILDFGGDEDLQLLFAKALWQGGCFYNPDFGDASLVAAIGGRLFLVTPSISDNTATVTDITIPGDPNPATPSQAWLWQAERWVIWNDGISLPVFFDGSSSRRSYGPSVQIAVVDVPGFTGPAIGASVQVNLTAPYTGPLNIPVLVIDGAYIGNYTLKEPAPGPAVPNARLTTVYTGGPSPFTDPTFVIPAGDQVFSIPSRIGVFSTSITPEAGILASNGATNPPTNEKIVFWSNLDITNIPPAVPSFPITTWLVGATHTLDVSFVSNFAGSGPAGYNGIIKFAAYGHSTTSPPANFSDTVITYNNPNPNSLLGTVVTPFTTPTRLNTLDVVLDTPYTGPDDSPVWIGDMMFTISKIPAPAAPTSVTLVNNSDPAGHVFPAATTTIFSVAELPAGRMGAYGMGRNWESLIDGRSFLGSDIVGGSSGSVVYQFRDAVLKTTENDYLAGGGVFVIPGSMGDIRAMIFTATLDTSLGQGALQVGTPTTIFSCNAPVERTDWQNLTNPILTESLKGSGPLGQNSTILANSDTLFRSVFGLGSLILARREFATWGNVPISREVERIIKFDSVSLLGFGSAVVFGNRLLETAFPTPSSLGVFHQGAIALNFDPISSLGGKSASVYDGLWLGINTLQWVRGLFNGTERAFAFSFNRLTTEIELYELLQDGAARFDHDGVSDVRIKWSFETASLFADVRGKNWYDLVQLQDGEFYVSEVVGDLDFEVWYKPQFHPCWVLWHSGQICATPRDQTNPADVNIQPQNRVAVGIGRPDMRICDPVNNRPFAVGETFQFKFVFTGTAKFYGAVFRASAFPSPAFAKVACDPICVELGDANCEECKTLDCVVDNDFALYTLQDRLPVLEPPAVFNNEVFFTHACAEGETLSFSGTLPGWITFDEETGIFTGAAGTFQAGTQIQANLLAQQALDAFGAAALLSGDLSCASAMECIAPLTTIDIVGQTGDEIAASTDLAVSRVLAGTTDTLFNSQLSFINAATNTLILNVTAGWAGMCYVESTQMFAVTRASGANRFIDFYNTSGVLQNTLDYTAEDPGQGLGTAITYEAVTDRVYVTGDDLNSAWLIAINPNDYSVTSADTGGAPAQVGVTNTLFSSPGRVYYLNQANTGVIGVNVPANTVIGTLATTVFAKGLDYAPTTGKIYLGTTTPSILEVDPATMAIDFTYTIPAGDQVQTIKFDPIQERLIAFKRDGNGYVINPVTREFVCTVDFTVETGFGTSRFAIDYGTGRVYFVNDDTYTKLFVAI